MQGLATFPGIQHVLSARYTLAQGITPGVCHIECAPQAASVAAVGTLTLQFGGVRLEFPGMRTDQASARRGAGGLIYGISLRDRRWKWNHGAIHGCYNDRDSRGELLAESEREPRQLARMLLEAMGETRFDVSALPNDARPRVAWHGANPAVELANLAEAGGCVVVLKPNGAVVLEPFGQGAALPELPETIEAGATITSAEAPAAIVVWGAPTIVQARLPLQAVGLETDGTIKPIDELSYRPPGGWSSQTDQFPSLTSDHERRLAVETVFRWYRIDEAAGNLRSALPPELRAEQLQVEHLWQILPVGDELLEWRGHQPPGPLARRGPRVLGRYWLRNLGWPVNSSPTRQFEYQRPFRLHSRLGLVEFAEPVRAWSDQTKRWEQAELYLDAAFHVRHQQTRAPHRFSYRLELAPAGGIERVLHAGELRLQWLQQRPQPESEAFEWRESCERRLLERDARWRALGAARQHQGQIASDALYAGLVPLAPDGAIREVCWEVGPRGTFTRAARNADRAAYLPGYAQRRLFERLRGQMQQAGSSAQLLAGIPE